MLLANLPSSKSIQTSMIGILLGFGFELSVYRLSAGNADITLLRMKLNSSEKK